MKNFMIGMYGKYDEAKFNRDFRENFYGIEACLLRNEEDVEKLIKNTERNGIRFGIHFPLRYGFSILRDQQFLSLDEDIRKNAYKYIEEELDYIKKRNETGIYIISLP